MSLREIMTKEVTSLPDHASVLDAAKFMTDMNVGSVIVVNDSKPLGIVTDRDIMKKALIEGKDAGTVKVKDIMVSPVITVSEDRDVMDVTNLMNSSGVRRFPVVDSGGNVIGVISLDDVLMFLGQEMQNVANAVRSELQM